MKKIFILLVGFCLFSCASSGLVTEVTYRSFRNNDPVKHEIKSLSEVPSTAKIAVATRINHDYSVDVVVYNLTNQTMSIDRTQSFFTLPTQQVPYYNPQITTHTNTVGSGNSVGVNIGAVAGAFGAGGVVGRALGGVNIGGSSSESFSTTTYDIDIPVIHIPPKGHASMGRSFSIKTILESVYTSNNFFGLCIAYSTDRLQSIDNFVLQYNMNKYLIADVRQVGKNYYVNEALREIYIAYPELFNERFFRLWFGRDTYSRDRAEYSKTPILFDYK